MSYKVRLTWPQLFCLIFAFSLSTTISYLVVAFKLASQWTPDVIAYPQVTSFMIQASHASNISFEILSHNSFLADSIDNAQVDGDGGYHPEWGTRRDPKIRASIFADTNMSYDNTDFSVWWTEGDGAPLFINASKYDRSSQIGYQSFVFCPIPKVGCSAWKQLMRRIKGIDSYLADDYWSLHHAESNGLEMDRIYRPLDDWHGVSVDRANAILSHVDNSTNQSIFFAVFVRDSIERALSAFLDKCVQSQWHHKYWCKPQTVRANGVYSHFDVFVESIISQPQEPAYKRYGFWGMDFHWLPQNWICDIYKFIDRYHVYDADTVLHRKNFLLNIGGHKLWQTVGASGWFRHSENRVQTRRRMIIEHDPELFVIPKYAPFEYVDTVNNITRQHPPSYRGFSAGQTLDISGSLLSENAAHTQHTKSKVFTFFRSDLLAKLIVFYADDYVLFERTLPDWICHFVDMQPVLRRLTAAVAGDTLLRFDAESALFFGNASVFHPNANDTQKNNWTEHRIQLSLPLRQNVRLDCMYPSMVVTDTRHHTLFSFMRGTHLLLDVLSQMQDSMLPNRKSCQLSLDVLQENIRTLTDIFDVYFNEYVPRTLNDTETGAHQAWLDVAECLQLTKVGGRIDVGELSERWSVENARILENLLRNMLYSRDIPRSARYPGNVHLDDQSWMHHFFQSRLKIIKQRILRPSDAID